MYSYTKQRERIFTERGSELLMEIRDRARTLLRTSGAATMDRLIAGSTGDPWDMMATVHYMEERGELLSVFNQGRGQDQVFVAGPKWREY